MSQQFPRLAWLAMAVFRAAPACFQRDAGRSMAVRPLQLTVPCRYEGEYHENKRHGRGTFVFADGSQYVGEYRADKKHGLGTYTYPNGVL